MQRKRVLFVVMASIILLSIALPELDQSVQAQDTKSLVVAFDEEVDNLNPMYTTMYVAGIVRELYLAPAWDFDTNLNPHPVLVTEIPSKANGGISENSRIITFKLRDDIMWSDGEPITASDFLFTYQMIVDQNNTPASRFPYDEKVTAVDTPDAQTVVVTFNEPFAPWLSWLFSYVLPEHILRPIYEEQGTLDTAAWNLALDVGSGPYVFAEWERGAFIRFTRNENYFGESPRIDTIMLAFVPDSESHVSLLESGNADVGPFIAYADMPRLQSTDTVSIRTVPSGYNESWFLNMNEATAHPAMLDVNVRKALVMAFNRAQITDEVLLGLTYSADSFWEATPFDNPNIDALAYDPVQAASLLDEAGWVDSDGDGIRDKEGNALSLRFITTSDSIRLETFAIAQQQLREIGIELALTDYAPASFFTSFGVGGPAATGQYDIAQWSASPQAFPDPDTSRFLCAQIPSNNAPFGINWTGLCDEELDDLFTEQSRTADYDERISIFHRIDARLADAVVLVGVWHDVDLWAVNNRVQNAALNSVTPFWNISEWDVQ